MVFHKDARSKFELTRAASAGISFHHLALCGRGGGPLWVRGLPPRYPAGIACRWIAIKFRGRLGVSTVWEGPPRPRLRSGILDYRCGRRRFGIYLFQTL